jgi:hypothetical protein
VPVQQESNPAAALAGQVGRPKIAPAKGSLHEQISMNYMGRKNYHKERGKYPIEHYAKGNLDPNLAIPKDVMQCLIFHLA